MSDKICQVKMASGDPCGRQTYKDEEKCVFHRENKSNVEEAKIFEMIFREELRRMEKDNDIKSLDFTGFIFPNAINFQKHVFEKPIIFVQVRFDNKANFSGAIFNEVDFSEAIFNEVDFSEAKFNSIASFTGVQFNNGVLFSKAQFYSIANFVAAEFKDEAYFPGVHFNNIACFAAAKFKNTTSFSGAQFYSEGFFSSTDFLSSVVFVDTMFHISNEHLIRFERSKFHKPKDVRFQNVDLNNVSFLNTDIIEIEFLDVRWAKKGGRLIVIDETRIGKDNTTYGAVAQLYRRLRRNYEANYRFAEAGEFFIGEMEMRRLDVNTNFKNKIIREIVLWFKKNFSLLGIYKHISLYGESYIRPAILTFIFIVFYPMLMHWLFNASIDNDLYNYMRKSTASFFQMDSTYVGERIIGIPILGLLFIALKRKFERKK